MIIFAAVFGVLALICLVRVALGPTIPDRIIAMDTINTLVVAILVLLGVAFEHVIYIDVAIVYATLSFVSTLYIAKYLEENK